MAFLLNNPNNHAYEGGPVTTVLEQEAIEQFLDYLGLSDGWGHLTSGGTAANLEAAWLARNHLKAKSLLCSQASHFAWQPIGDVLGLSVVSLPCDTHFRIDLSAAETALRIHPKSVVIGNFGSTGAGAVDDLVALRGLCDQHGSHLHVDAAYGGFTRTMLRSAAGDLQPHPLLSAHVNHQSIALNRFDEVQVFMAFHFTKYHAPDFEHLWRDYVGH